MTVREIIDALQKIDPSGESQVRMYFYRRYGGTTKEVTEVRRFLSNGAVMITDGPREEC